MLHPILRIALVLAVGVTVACGGRVVKAPGTFDSRYLITREDIEKTHAVNAYDAVERLRSHWLRVRGTTQMPAPAGGVQFEEAQVLVYIDDQKFGPVESLKRIEIAAVEYIRFYGPAEASSRWGFGHGGGVIFVSTRPM